MLTLACAHPPRADPLCPAMRAFVTLTHRWTLAHKIHSYALYSAGQPLYVEHALGLSIHPYARDATTTSREFWLRSPLSSISYRPPSKLERDILYTQVALCPSMAARTRSIWISVNAHELNELQTPSPGALDASHCSCSTSPTRTGTIVA